MALNTYSDLKFEIIAVGNNDGTWGPIVNTNVGTAIEQAIVGMATLATGDFTANVATLSATDTNAAQNFRAFCLNITATLSAAGTINVPAIEKPYLVINNSVGGFAVTVKVSGLTGVSIPNGKACLVYNNGTDVGAAITHLTSLTLASALPVLSGGTGVTTSTGSGNNVLSTSPTLVTPALGTPASGILSACTVDGTNLVGYQNIPVNSQSADYTLILSDAGKSIFHPSTDTNDRTFTIPSNASVAYPIGTAISFLNMSNIVTIAINSDTMYWAGSGATGSRLLSQYGSAAAIKMTSTTWIISGSNLS